MGNKNIFVRCLMEIVAKMNETVTTLSDNVNKLTNNRPRGPKPPVRKDNVECYRCHLRGHYARDCVWPVPQNNGRINPHASSARPNIVPLN